MKLLREGEMEDGSLQFEKRSAVASSEQIAAE
jgi:hypothetical protein